MVEIGMAQQKLTWLGMKSERRERNAAAVEIEIRIHRCTNCVYMCVCAFGKGTIKKGKSKKCQRPNRITTDISSAGSPIDAIPIAGVMMFGGGLSRSFTSR